MLFMELCAETVHQWEMSFLNHDVNNMDNAFIAAQKQGIIRGGYGLMSVLDGTINELEMEIENAKRNG